MLLDEMALSIPETVAEAISEQGSRHTRNDDRWGLYDAARSEVRAAGRGLIYAVADGVSSTKEGDRAAEVAIEGLERFFLADRAASRELLIDVVESVDADVRMTTGAACTLAGVWLAEGVATVFSVGDSSVLVYRNGELRHLTPMRVRQGLSAYVGMGSGIRHSVFLEDEALYDDDIFLIVSDGVLTALGEEEVGLALGASQDFQQLVRLMRGLLRGHNQDDATLVGVQVTRSHGEGYRNGNA